MLSFRQRFPSRGSVAARPPSRAQLVAMVPGPAAGMGTGEFAGSEGPPQNVFGAALRELRVSLLDAATAIRLGDTSSKPRFFGTEAGSPQALIGPTSVNSPDEIDASIVSSGNAPQAINKTSSGAPRIARSLPLRPM